MLRTGEPDPAAACQPRRPGAHVVGWPLWRAIWGSGGTSVSGATALRLVAVAALYYVGAWIGLLQELVRDQVTPLWPPTGIALACLLTLGPMAWPGIALGAVAVNAPIGPSPLAVLAIVVGNTLAPICSYLLLRRVDFRPTLDRLRDALVLVFLGALAGMLISATVGTAALVVSGALPVGDFWTAWSVWWTGDAMGVLVITPLLLVLHRAFPHLLHRARPPRGVSPYRPLEAAALLLGTAGVTLVATRTEVSLLFLVFPFLIWAALRFTRGQRPVLAHRLGPRDRRDGGGHRSVLPPFAAGPDGHPPGVQRLDGPDGPAAVGDHHRTERHPPPDRTRLRPTRRRGLPPRPGRAPAVRGRPEVDGPAMGAVQGCRREGVRGTGKGTGRRERTPGVTSGVGRDLGRRARPRAPGAWSRALGTAAPHRPSLPATLDGQGP